MPWLQMFLKIRSTIKAACDAGSESAAQICVDFGGTRKYIEAGQLTTSFKTFSFEFEIPEGMVHCFFYNTEGDTAVYITDIEILGYASSYTETALAVLKDSILTEVSKKVGLTKQQKRSKLRPLKFRWKGW